jgi:hypothetical protein
VYDVNVGSIDMNTDTFYVMLTTNSYTPNKKTHTKRSDVTNEVVGAGYTAGGQAVTPTVTNDTANDRTDITFADVTWPASTITARFAVVYKRRGGASSADELVAACDFGSDISTTAGTFTLDFTGPLRYQN